ncbi:protein MANNAN SYNTHESIS-RELATED 1-like [Oryza brachyantha]|uniref:O-fucosyltransferase family protein n=1 Tax=Oryza brachyantha TaxID=4533 RepID=J3MYU9_ORYBR|nr:protein MANNAN SYNTHESIS-RELATED 1-like [Oryza brachyantha]
MTVDPRQLVAGFLTLSMFVMLGNMIKHDHFTPVGGEELALETAGVDSNEIKVADTTEITKVNTVGVDLPKETAEEIRPCWSKPSPNVQESKGFVTFSLTMGPEFHISQITDAVVIARYLGATLVLPEIRGNELGKRRKFEDMYDVDKFMTSLDGVVKVVHSLPNRVSAKKPAVIRVPNRVTEEFISGTIEPIFQRNNYLRLATIFSSISLKQKESSNKDLDSTACLAMFSGLELKPEFSAVAKHMLDRLKEISKPDGMVIAVDMQTELLEKKNCKTSGGSRRRGCYYPQEVLNFLKKVGFSANTTIYLTETWWHKSLNTLKEAFPNTYTKDDIMPAANKGEFLKSGDSYLARALDLKICSESDVFVPAIPGLFYGHVAGKRIASGLTNIIVPAPVSSTSALASEFISTYISKKSHLAYSCYC